MIRIVTDTTAGLLPDLAAQHGIAIVPQVIIFGEEEYLEGVELDQESYLQKLTTSSVLPKTAAPAPAALEAIYRPWVEAGDTILSIHPSTELSGTVRSATVARQSFPGADIRIIDTRSIGGPLARIALLAAQWAAEGVDADSIVGRIDDLIARQRIYFLVDTLEYLQKGGRIGGASALLGGLLQIKPILTLQDGKVEVGERQRTHKKALARLRALALSEAAPADDALFTVMHANTPELAKKIAQDLAQAHGANNIMVMHLGPAIVTHAGPGSLAIGFFTSGGSHD